MLLINRYTEKYFSYIFRVVVSSLNMRSKKIILFTMIMLFLPLPLLSDNNDTLWFNKYIDTEGDRQAFFVFEISKKDKNIVNSSFDNIDSNITTHTKNGNLYNLKYPNGYSSTIELVKKRIEFIEYFSINVEIHKNNELQYKFSSDSSEYSDYRYPNCVSQHGNLGFDEGVIKVNYNKNMTNSVAGIIKTNQWLPFVYHSSRDDGVIKKVVDQIFMKKEICDNDTCVVQVIVKVGEEFNAISKINGLDNGICATRILLGPAVMAPMEPVVMPPMSSPKCQASGKCAASMSPKKPVMDPKKENWIGENLDLTNKSSEIRYKVNPEGRKRAINPEELRKAKILLDAWREGKSLVDLAIEKLKKANIVFDTPSSMYRNKTYIINLKLDAAKDIDILLEELDSAEKESAVVKYSSTMKAELISENKKAFEITPITPDTQVISSINTTSWKWDVTPLEQGEQNLHLSLTAFLDIAGKEKALSIKTFDKVIKVNISYPDEISFFIQINWKWILGSLLFPLVGLWWKNKGKKEEE